MSYVASLMQAIEMLREQAAAAQKASDEMHERDVEEMRVTADKLIQVCYVSDISWCFCISNLNPWTTKSVRLNLLHVAH